MTATTFRTIPKHPALNRESIRARRGLPSREQVHSVMAHESGGYLIAETLTDDQWRYIGQVNGMVML